MSDFSIRLARPDDTAHLPAIERAAAVLFRDTAEGAAIDLDEVRTVADYRGMIAKGYCLVAEIDERIVGFLASRPAGRELHVEEMDVHSDAQRKGIGSVLMRACIVDAQNSGFRALTLTTFRDLGWNGPFYARLGFVEVEDLDAHPRLAQTIAQEISDGLPADSRIAMIRFLS